MGTNNPHQGRAIFLDRDGVINRNIFNPASGKYEAPLEAAQFEFAHGALDAMRGLRTGGFHLFLVSNQPNYAKGKSSLQDLWAIHHKLVEGLLLNTIDFTQFYYCFHHPQGIGNLYSRPCNCRKPSPHFLLRARTDFDLDLSRSWMVGDRLTDVECGNRAGTRTILIAADLQCSSDRITPDEIAPDLSAAAKTILAAD